MLASFFNANMSFNKSLQARLYKYGFIIYLPKHLPLRELNNIKSIIKFLGGSSFFFNLKVFQFDKIYSNCLVITFTTLEYVIHFPYYLDTIFSNFNYFPIYFKFNSNLIPLANNFIFDRVNCLININKNKLDWNIELDIQKRRLFILFKLFFNFFFLLNRVKQCQR